MDSGKNKSRFQASSNHKIYMDLKYIIREHALQFLPAKSLLKFRAVCREWRSIISTPFFAHNQSLSFSSVSGMFIQSTGDLPKFISIDPVSCGVPDPALKFLPVPIDVLSSSNGLVCCQAQTGDRDYYICNPVTMLWKKLPKPTMEHGREPAAVLIFKPSLLNFVAEYKLVVAFTSNDFDDATEFEIYSSKDDSWKVSGEIHFAAKKMSAKSGVSLDDVVYWQTSNGSILVFDVTKNRCQLLHGYHGGHASLGEFRGKVCSAYISGRTLMVNAISNIHCDTMQMNSQARLWGNKIIIPLPSEVSSSGSYDHLPVLYAGNDIVLIYSGNYIYSCDLKTKAVKFLVEAPRANQKVVPYVNSLVGL